MRAAPIASLAMVLAGCSSGGVAQEPRAANLTDSTFGAKRVEAILETYLGDPLEGVPKNFQLQFRAASECWRWCLG